MAAKPLYNSIIFPCNGEAQLFCLKGRQVGKVWVGTWKHSGWKLICTVIQELGTVGMWTTMAVSICPMCMSELCFRNDDKEFHSVYKHAVNAPNNVAQTQHSSESSKLQLSQSCFKTSLRYTWKISIFTSRLAVPALPSSISAFSPFLERYCRRMSLFSPSHCPGF